MMLTLVAGLAALLGGWLAISFSLASERMAELTALGAGFLLGGALFTLVPGAMHAAGTGYLFVGFGFLGMFAFRSLTSPGNQHYHGGEIPAGQVATAAFAGLAVHSLVDGAALGAALHHGGSLGVTAFLAIFVHKVPEGFSVAALGAASGSRRLGLAAAAALGLVTVAGGLIPLIWASFSTIPHGPLLGLAAGSFLYVGATDVLPSLAGRGRGALSLVLAGAILVLMLTRVTVAHLH